MGFLDKLKQGLSKTRDALSGKVESVIKAFEKVDEELFEELEEALITADVGAGTALYIIQELRDRAKKNRISDSDALKQQLREIVTEILEQHSAEPLPEGSPAVILVIGVNGSGKTTSAGKLAIKYKREGKRVMLAAADTFRAAAIDQLQIWADRCGCEMIRHQEGSDPSAVVFDALASAKAKGVDVLICDTAGRLHNKKNLMDELNKISRVIDRVAPDSPKQVLLVLDATTGQNALSQAKLFDEAAGIDGIILTKLDGTAKGGVVIGICREQNIPIYYVGVGEGENDLDEFVASDFARALFE